MTEYEATVFMLRHIRKAFTEIFDEENKLMHLSIPDHFREVDKETFDDYLTWCQDYNRTAYGNCDVYGFNGTGITFAYVDFETGKVFVNPKVLK